MAGLSLYWLGRVAAVNQNIYLDLGGTMLTATTTNSALLLIFDGNANFGASLTYYQAA
jgi:hypothetical protein